MSRDENCIVEQTIMQSRTAAEGDHTTQCLCVRREKS